MFKKNKINFTLEGIKGEMKLVYNIIGTPKLYQNGELLKKEGFLKMKFLVTTDNGQEYIEIKRGLSFTFSAIFRGKETFLEAKLSTIEYIIGAVPLLVLIFTGGFLGALIAIVGVNANFNFMRSEKRLGIQIVFALSVTAICYILYLLLALLLALIIY